MYRSVPARCLTGRWPCSSRHELVRREIVEARMWAYFVVVPPPCFDDHLRPGAGTKPFEAQSLVTELAVEAFGDPFCQGLPGSINAMPIFCAAIQDNSALDTNSGPLSLRSTVGTPRALIRRDSTSITRAERMRPSTSIANPSLVNSSVTVRHLSC